MRAQTLCSGEKGGGADVCTEREKMVSVGTQTPSSWLSTLSQDVQNDKTVKGNEKSDSSDNHLPDITANHSGDRETSRPRSRPPAEQLSLPPISSGGGVSEVITCLHDSSSSSSTEEEDSVLPSLQEPAAVGHNDDEVPWPTVLKYLRESESEASKYFRLDQEPPQFHRESEQLTEIGIMSREVVEDDEARYAEDQARDQGLVQQVCQFCKQPFGQWSVLEAASTTGAPAEACCWQFKEYCLLVAKCLRQMTAERATAPPTEISVTRRGVKAVAEKRARALVSQRRRWEERQRKKLAKKTLQSSSFYSLTKQTKTIQFSLLSPAVLNAGWTEGEKKKGNDREDRRRRKKKNTKTLLPPEVLDFLKRNMQAPQEVEKTFYPNSDCSFCTLLPNRTGQYLYPSGSVAVLIYSHIPGVLNQLLFNESGEEVIGYADELGRVWCCYPPPNTHFLRLRGNIGGAGEVYSMTGDVVNRWGAADTSCQPLTFSLNENLSLQIPTKAEAFINFTVGQLHARITVTNKLKERKYTLPLAGEEARSCGEEFRSYLSQAQARLKYFIPSQSSRKKERVPRGRSRSTGTFISSSTHNKLV